MRRLAGMAIAAAGLLVAAACAGLGTAAQTSPTEGDPAVRFGACAEQGEVDLAPPLDLVASAERWLEVRATSPALTDASLVAEQRTAEVVLDVEGIDSNGGRIGDRSPTPIWVHNSALPGIDWSLRSGGHAFLALGSDGLEREMVLYAMVRSVEEPAFFAGYCQFEGLTQPLRAQLGARYESAMAEIIGKTDREAIESILIGDSGTTSPGPVEPPVILNPEDVDPSVLDGLESVSVELEVPSEWRGPYSIYTRIDAGWNDCIDLSVEIEGIAMVDAYLDESGELEIWLLDAAADLSDPLQHLGTVDAGPADPGGGTDRTVRIRLSGVLVPESGGRAAVHGAGAALA